MSKVTVHPDALKLTMQAWRDTGMWKDSIEAAIQWYIDHPQITSEQCFTLRCTPALDGSIGQQSPFIREFLTLALSGKPEVPQELRNLLDAQYMPWDKLHSADQERALAIYNLGKGAKS